MKKKYRETPQLWYQPTFSNIGRLRLLVPQEHPLFSWDFVPCGFYGKILGNRTMCCWRPVKVSTIAQQLKEMWKYDFSRDYPPAEFVGYLDEE